MSQGYLIENAKPILSNVPINTTGAIAAGDWCHFRHYRRAQVQIWTGAWAGGTPAVTLNQAKTNSGGSTKALAFDRYWITTALTSDAYVQTAVVSNTFNLSGVANQVYIMEIHVDDLDKSNGFYYFNVSVASPGANADLICISYQLYDAAHAIKIDNAPTVISG
jgi:hypothetical protein